MLATKKIGTSKKSKNIDVQANLVLLIFKKIKKGDLTRTVNET